MIRITKCRTPSGLPFTIILFDWKFKIAQGLTFSEFSKTILSWRKNRPYKNKKRVQRYQRQPLEVLYRKDVLRNFTKFTGKHLCKSLFGTRVFLWILWKERLLCRTLLPNNCFLGIFRTLSNTLMKCLTVFWICLWRY